MSIIAILKQAVVFVKLVPWVKIVSIRVRKAYSVWVARKSVRATPTWFVTA